MSGERELLEFAAKAADFIVGTVCEKRGVLMMFGGKDYDWNPLMDDGDALRLAVKLRMPIVHFYSNTSANGFREPCNGEDETDRMRATRLAIVRAAAAIGKALP